MSVDPATCACTRVGVTSAMAAAIATPARFMAFSSVEPKRIGPSARQRTALDALLYIFEMAADLLLRPLSLPVDLGLESAEAPVNIGKLEPKIFAELIRAFAHGVLPFAAGPCGIL